MAGKTTSLHEDLAINLYVALMREVKTRIGAIQGRLEVLRRDPPSPTAFLDAEFCFLQIRMICEIVALSSLSAHSPLGLGKAILKYWNADRLFSDLEKINSNCFPRPLCVNAWNEGRISFAAGDYMGIKELRAAYVTCGDFLHRGTGQTLLQGKPKRINVKWVRDVAANFVELLSNHVIYVAQIEAFFIASMNSAPNGDVNVSILKLADDMSAAALP